ncbi:MAG: peptidoglycan-binding domain-containing protein [Candidatus Aenigmatarchaeota archaeon]
MKIPFLIIIILMLILSGCGKKTKEEELPFKPEEISSILEEVPTLSKVDKEKTTEKKSPVVPTSKNIQIALKNAGFYKGKIDGIIGPKTLKAIKEFQAKNNLEVDGKVGPKTWAKLKEYLYLNKKE